MTQNELLRELDAIVASEVSGSETARAAAKLIHDLLKERDFWKLEATRAKQWLGATMKLVKKHRENYDKLARLLRSTHSEISKCVREDRATRRGAQELCCETPLT